MEMHPILSALFRSKTGAILVAAQIALTLAIVCNALFVVNARLETASRPSGVADEDSIFETLYVTSGKVDDLASMRQRDLETLRGIPGVVSVAGSNQIPMAQSGWGLDLAVDPNRPDSAIGAAAFFSSESIVKTFGLEIVEGRDFEDGDIREVDSRKGQMRADSVILSRPLARRLFPDATAVGKIVHLGTGVSSHPMRVVGVVEMLMGPGAQAANDRAYSSFIMPVRYLDNVSHFAVRTAPGDTARVMAEAEKALSALRTDRVKIHFRTVSQIRERRYRHERGGASILIAVTVGLLLVTASGIVGVASLWVSQRRKQIGVRRALGARRRDIIRYFVTENFVITTLGVAAGVALAIGLNLYLVSHVELARLPLTYVVGGMMAVWVLGLVAVLGPAWRAASVPPATATRSA